jgi:hypothetical protein
VTGSAPVGGKLYRGVPRNTRRGQEALRGIVRPRGTFKDYVAHVLNQPAATDVTSWTRDRKQASRFGDIILEIDEAAVAGKIVPHPLPNRFPEEQEVLIRGVLTNVQQAP